MRGPSGIFDPVGSVSHYDLVLAVIPSVFVLAVLLGNLLSVPPRASIGAASVVAALALLDALFLNPPSADGA